jgi:hypothetical protein
MPITVPYSETWSAFTVWTKAGEKSAQKKASSPRPRATLLRDPRAIAKKFR